MSGVKSPAAPGYRTLVTPESALGIKHEDLEVPQQALPPGAATPAGAESDASAGREIPKPESNTPGIDSDIAERPRTTALPGEETVGKTKYDYNYVTRRNMTAQVARRFLAGGRPVLADPDEVDEFDNDPWELAHSVGVRVLSNKDLRAMYVVGSEIVAALFDASDPDGYEFDVVVSPEWQRKGLGSKLMDIALDQFEENAEAYGEGYALHMDVINPVAARMLKQRGLVETGREHGHILMTRMAYTRQWKPGHRQTRSRGKERQERRQYYRQNRGRLKMRARRYYRRNRNNSQFKRVRKHRRVHPNQHRRRRADLLNTYLMGANPSIVAALYLDTVPEHMDLRLAWEPPEEMYPKERQTKQRGEEKRDSKMEYLHEPPSTKIREQKKRYHQFCKRNKRCMKKRKLYRENPDRFKRKKGSVLTAPQIAFAFGPDFLYGTVHAVSPMTGMVTFHIHDKDEGYLHSLPVQSLLRVSVFLSEADIEAFFDLVDVEVGEEAYADIDVSVVQDCADVFSVEMGDEFRNQCEALFGKGLDDLDPDELEELNDTLVIGVLEGGGGDRGDEEGGVEDDADGDGDDDLIFGVVVVDDDEDPRLASDILYVDVYPTAPGGRLNVDDARRDWRARPPAEGHPGPDKHEDQADPSSQRVAPQDNRSFPTEQPKRAATIGAIMDNTFEPVHERAGDVTVRLSKADPARGRWTFTASGSKGETYTIKLKGIRKGNVTALSKAQVQVSCNCNFFRWQGPEHWAKQNDYLLGKPVGTASQPIIRDPAQNHWACKHVIAALRLAQNYHFGGDVGFPRVFDIVPDYADRVAMVRRVAMTYLR